MSWHVAEAARTGPVSAVEGYWWGSTGWVEMLGRSRQEGPVTARPLGERGDRLDRHDSDRAGGDGGNGAGAALAEAVADIVARPVIVGRVVLMVGMVVVALGCLAAGLVQVGGGAVMDRADVERQRDEPGQSEEADCWTAEEPGPDHPSSMEGGCEEGKGWTSDAGRVDRSRVSVELPAGFCKKRLGV